MDDAPLPDVRASDADRERIAERLRRATADGQLTPDELEERLTSAYTARTRRELVPLTADLQGHDALPVAAEPSAPETFTVRPGDGGARWLIAVMSGCDRKGRWRLGRRATNVNLMGGANLDLNAVELAGERTELSVVSIMGGADIWVPEGLRVEVSEFSLMGGNDIRLGDRPQPTVGPVLHLKLFSLMGGNNVRRGVRRRRQR
jgi:DUF1707 SHOCT-like domain